MNELTTMSNRFGHRVAQQARILNLFLFETGEYQQQVRRPYVTQMDHRTVMQFQEQLNGLSHYSPQNMSGIAQSFLTPRMKPESNVEIPGGWNERKCRFMMLVEYDGHMGSRMQEILTGFTTHVGAQQAGMGTGSGAGLLHVDDELVFIVNSTIKLQRAEEFGPRGRVEHFTVASNTHVFADPNFTTMYQPKHEERMRPGDVFAAIQTAPLRAVAEDTPQQRGMFDTRTVNHNQAVLSKRSNVIPTNHVARVFESFNNARTAEYTNPGGSNGDVYGMARGNVLDGLVSDDVVLRIIGEFRGEGAPSSFKFKDLKRMDPNVTNVVRGRVSGMTQKLGDLHNPSMSNQWDGRNNYTLIATILSQCVPGIMSDLGLTRMCFECNNQIAVSGQYSAVNADARFGRPDGMPFFVPTNVRSVSGQSGMDRDLSDAAWKFEHRFWGEVMQGICANNQIPFSLKVNCDLYGETVVTMSFDSGPWEQFVTPSFADALLTPLTTTSQNHLTTVAEDFSVLMNSVMKKEDSHGIGFSIEKLGSDF